MFESNWYLLYLDICAAQELLLLPNLPRFVALEMIVDMSTLENKILSHQFPQDLHSSVNGCKFHKQPG